MLGASTHSFSEPPICSGTAVAPLPTVRLRKRLGVQCRGEQRRCSSEHRGPNDMRLLQAKRVGDANEELAIALGDMRASRRSECPNPGRSIATRCVSAASRFAWARRNRCLRPWAQQQHVNVPPLTLGVANRQTVDRAELRLNRSARGAGHRAIELLSQPSRSAPQLPSGATGRWHGCPAARSLWISPELT